MEPARSIGQLGFRRWYERRLWESFGWLLIGLLCGFMVLGVFEMVGLRTPGLTPLITLLALYLIGLAGVRALMRFVATLGEAQRLANHSTCTQCGTYGRYQVLSESARMRVQCRKCSGEWTIEQRL